jgi:cytochrome oxidase assembly protein ShyY1
VIRLLFPLLLVAMSAVIAHGVWQLDRRHMKAAAAGVVAAGLVAAGLVMILLGD